MLISDRIPITVGVVGHLDVITTEEQKLQIENLFRHLGRRISKFTCLPVLINCGGSRQNMSPTFSLTLKKRMNITKKDLS